MRHTATPWSIDTTRFWGGHCQIIAGMYKGPLEDGSGMSVIASIYGSEANAEYICRAVNSHGELVKTAKMFRAVLLGELTCEPHFLEKLEVAIAKAEGK